jgi:hypothetical protein
MYAPAGRVVRPGADVKPLSNAANRRAGWRPYHQIIVTPSTDAYSG